MRAINHALTGAVIGTVVTNPAAALPLALISHFVLDAVPHFGIDRQNDIKTSWFRKLLVLDAALCLGLVLILAAAQAPDWFFVSLCAFVATAPDLMSIPRYVYWLKQRKIVLSDNPIIQFHHRIQTEVPAGAVIEIVWAGMMIFLLRLWL